MCKLHKKKVGLLRKFGSGGISDKPFANMTLVYFFSIVKVFN